MTYRPDLAAYLARIGYAGPTPPTVDTLHALSHAHVSTIPFENADVLLDRGIDLDPAAVEAKLVGAGRGGYCFEHNSLFLHVLTALGFAARPISAALRNTSKPQRVMPPTSACTFTPRIRSRLARAVFTVASTSTLSGP